MKHILPTIDWRFREGAPKYPMLPSKSISLGSPQDIFTHFNFLFQRRVRERFVVIWLNTANRAMGYEIITEGLLNSSLVHPREVFRGAIVATCASVVVAHNHPSGVSEPSPEDIQITHQLVEAGKIVGIPVLDHIIFSDGGYLSFAERGIIHSQQPPKGGAQ